MKRWLGLLFLVLAIVICAVGVLNRPAFSDTAPQEAAGAPAETGSSGVVTTGRSEDFQIIGVDTQCCGGEVTFTVRYTAPTDAWWYLWRLYERGGVPAQWGRVPKGTSSFSFTVSAARELNESFSDIGEAVEWFIYLSEEDILAGSGTEGALFDTWRIGDRGFFEDAAG